MIKIANTHAFQLCCDPELRGRYSNLLDLLTGQNLDDADETAAQIRQAVEDSVKRTVDQYADVQFFTMKKSGNWGRASRDAVEFGYCRLKVGVSPDQDVDQEHLRTFERLLDENRLSQLSLEQLDKREDGVAFKLFGKKIKLRDTHLVNDELRFCGSKNRVVTSMQGKLRNLIYGEATCSQLDGYDLYHFHRELSRTPTEVLSMPGCISAGDIVIREEACRAVFTLKWQPAADVDDLAAACLYDDTAENIRETIKQHTLAAYGIRRPDQARVKQQLIIDEIGEGVLWHEIGHSLHYRQLTLEQTAIAKAFRYFGDSIGSVLIEALADWATGPATLQGPIKEFVSLADRDPQKATRMLLAYMSDNWFLDTADQQGGAQTEVLVSLLCPFIGKTRAFDFAAMAVKHDEIYRLLFETSLGIGTHAAELTRNATYDVEGTPYGYDFIAKNIDVVVAKGNPHWAKDSVDYQTAIWHNSFMLLEKRAPDDFAEVQQAINDADAAFRVKLLELLVPEQALQYGGRARDYLFDQMKAKGFFAT